METPLILPQTYSPGSDIAAGFRPNQIVWGRTGNDTVLGYLSAKNRNSITQTVDILLGDTEIPLLIDPVPRDWRNTFVLGDWKRPYYVSENSSVPELNNLGLNDFAIIGDFNSKLDRIQLHGTKLDYQLTNFGLGTAIWTPRTILPDFTITPDVIGILPAFNPNLDANYFEFTGHVPLEESVLKQIQQIGTSGFDFSNSVATDLSGNVYLAGVTTGSLGGSSFGLRDVWLNKYNSKGDLLWTQQFGSAETDFVLTITVETDNLFLAGLTEGDLGGEMQGGISDAWLAKYDLNGNQQWIQKVQGNSSRPTSSNSIDVDVDGNVYLSGVSDSFNPQESELPVSTDFWVAKYDSNGNQQWFQQLGKLDDGTEFDESYSNAVDQDGNVYSTGFTTSDLAGTNAGLYDAWLTKHDKNGQLQWIRQFGTEDYEWAWGVDTDSIGNIYVGGYTLGNIGGTNAGSYDSWLAKYDAQGNQLWIRQLGSPGDDEAFSLKIDSLDNIFLAGYTDDDLGGANSGSYDAWIAKFDSNGNKAWIQQFGTPQLEQVYDISIDNASNIYLTGLSDGSIGGINAGSFDAWIAKLDAESGILKNFSNTSDLIPPVITPPTPKQGKLLYNDKEISEFLDEFFTDFFISNQISISPYSPYPPYSSTKVPESSSGLSVLMFTVFGFLLHKVIKVGRKH